MEGKSPIGVFDSGYGGLSILKEIVRLLPEYDYLYLGDNARTPYGTRSFDVVYQYTKEAVKKLFDLGCPLVILACNTASAKALRTIQQIDLPHIDSLKRVLGVIRPSVEALPNYSRNGHVGILATRGTVASESYPLEAEKLYGVGTFHITQKACPMWVPLVENNELIGEGTEFFVRKYIEELFATDPLIDTVVLGCTHYPLLLNLILRHVPQGVKVIEQGYIVANRLEDYLIRHPEMEKKLSKNGSICYLTTESPELFNPMASMFMGGAIEAEHICI
ncbi:glutamate racemase [Odoribacter lunatus]|uniref:glutamate racemase n=1 Tax=Odoribacter lunatus TaxID=2941335 RepID=UPI0020415E00|nr:glutamate racemase [Odoribacter lunatus]